MIINRNQQTNTKYLPSVKVPAENQEPAEPKDIVSIGEYDFPEPKIMPGGTFMEGFRFGLAAAIDPIGLALEGYSGDSNKGIHDNATPTIAQFIMKEDPRKTDFGKEKAIGTGLAVAIGLGLHVATSGLIPITAGIIDGAMFLGKKLMHK